jgi:signal transduction histidine kinase
MRGCLPGLGLIGIRERIQALGGSLQIRSTNSRGTRLEITAPLQEVEDANPGSARR